jgi:hypothetical protein
VRSGATKLATAPQIPDRRWRQGSIVPHKAVDIHLQLALEPEALLIVLTQDCDILHDDYEAEPNIELHIARPVAKKDGNLFHAKNPRRLQFMLGQQLYEIKIHERFIIPRVCLVNYTPSEIRLEDNLIRTIVNWTANRYIRSALPDKFNERLDFAEKQMKKIESLLKRRGALVTGIFLRVDPNYEINPEEKYRVILRFTARTSVMEQPDLAKQAIELTELIRQQFVSIAGVEIEDYKLVSEAEFSLDDLRETPRWDYDYLSYRASTPDNAVPAGA